MRRKDLVGYGRSGWLEAYPSIVDNRINKKIDGLVMHKACMCCMNMCVKREPLLNKQIMEKPREKLEKNSVGIVRELIYC